MNASRLPAVAIAIGVFAIIIAAYLISRTPGDVISNPVLGRESAPEPGATVPYTLAEGRSAADVGSDLQKLGVIRSGRQFEVLASLMGVQNRLSAGDYVLVLNSSVPTALEALMVKDKVDTLRVTFPEGIRVEEMAPIAERAGFGTAQEFLDAVAAAQLPPEFAASLPTAGALQGSPLQGYLFPDTYILPQGAKAADLVALMIDTLAERFSPELRAAAQARGLNPHQALTLAAIVEREAAIDDERPIIAAVFYNRLEGRDRLGADPTVQFAVSRNKASVEQFGYWKRELTLEDLKIVSPYNTRESAGLPPGPITNPGRAAIEAVARPADTNFYYFVADATKADGSHVFAVTLAEHEANIQRFGP